ncbi:hypothetical protein BJ508DRAFT_303019 [Ascobolus immersus RN42]|uniref:Uncharacterized protein n=1 Tax=Ascobolus immersus RN42 TaxID=1160509 RepID=A0A3N4IUT1_ASCIM|nr:hypothetical protein BJ508DRAFT_303019 [Ascobolus immersus RN42]
MTDQIVPSSSPSGPSLHSGSIVLLPMDIDRSPDHPTTSTPSSSLPESIRSLARQEELRLGKEVGISQSWDRFDRKFAQYFARRYLEYSMDETMGLTGPNQEIARYICGVLGKEWLEGANFGGSEASHVVGDPEAEQNAEASEAGQAMEGLETGHDLLKPRKRPDLRKRLIQCNSFELLSIFKENGVDFGPNECIRLYSGRRSYIHLAVSGAHKESVRFLLENGWSASHKAYSHSRLTSSGGPLASECAAFQRNWNADVLPIHEFLITPLLECFIQPRLGKFNAAWQSGEDIQQQLSDTLEIADLLLQNGADIDCCGYSPLKFWIPREMDIKDTHDALKSMELIKEFFNRGGSSRWDVGPDGHREENPIHILSHWNRNTRKFDKTGSLELIRVFASAGMELDTPLGIAAHHDMSTSLTDPYGSFLVASLLESLLSLEEAETKEWWSRKQTTLCRLVMSILAYDTLGSLPPVIRDRKAHYLACLRILVSHGANINALTVEGHEALHAAAACKSREVLDVLLDGDSDLCDKWTSDDTFWSTLDIGEREYVADCYRRPGSVQEILDSEKTVASSPQQSEWDVPDSYWEERV